MAFQIRKLIYIITFNLSLFLLLMNGIQNSSRKSKVNFIITETITLPISFIVGMSFISGSIASGLLIVNSENK